MSADVGEATNALRNYMFQNVYLNQDAKSEESKAEYVLEQLYIYYLKNINTLPEEHLKIYKNMHSEIEDIICDYIAGTTDRYAVNLFNNIFIPKPWQKY